MTEAFSNGYRRFAIRLIVLLITISIMNTLHSQETAINYKQVESQSYQLYLSQSWNELISLSREALNNDIDYFYLRLRLGIAYFNQNNFSKAATHFEKALEFDRNDPTSLEFLHLSYLYLNRHTEANAITKQFGFELAENYYVKFIQALYLESGTIQSDNIEKNEDVGQSDNNEIFNEVNLNGDKYYNQFGVRINPGRNVSVYLGVNHLQISKLKQLKTSQLVKTGYDTILANGWYYIDTIYSLNYNYFDDKYKLGQTGWYASATIAAGKGWTITPAIHYIHVKYNTLNASSGWEEYYAQSYDTLSSYKMEYTVKDSTFSSSAFVGSIGLNKSFSNFNAGVFGTLSNLNGIEQYQAGVSFGWFPLGNLNLYTNTKFVSIFENNKTYEVVEQLVGIKLFPNLWMEGFISMGEFRHYNSGNAYLVYNSGDMLKFRAGSNFIVPLTSKIELSLRYQYVKFDSDWYWLNENNEPTLEGVEYDNHLIVGGIKWNF